MTIFASSDVLVQILDARNPLLFRCEDLEDYVKEVDPHKLNLLLLNKADFLTEEQRAVWVEYFNKQHIRIAFFSAVLEEEKVRQINRIVFLWLCSWKNVYTILF